MQEAFLCYTLWVSLVSIFYGLHDEGPVFYQVLKQSAIFLDKYLKSILFRTSCHTSIYFLKITRALPKHRPLQLSEASALFFSALKKKSGSDKIQAAFLFQISRKQRPLLLIFCHIVVHMLHVVILFKLFQQLFHIGPLFFVQLLYIHRYALKAGTNYF